jgi:hypothetical protein
MVWENHTRMPEVGKATSCSTGSTAATSSTGRERQPDANHEGVLAEQGRNRSLGAGARGGKLERRRRGIALLQDDLGRAADLYRETLTLSWETGVSPVVQRTLGGLACAAGAKGEAQRAARLWGAAQALHETKGIPRDTDFLAEADARISAVRSSMGEEAWEKAWRKGRGMTLDEAVSYAMEKE